MKTIQSLNLLVRDYDEAISWFTRKLGFVVICDEALSDEARFVRIAPGKDSVFSLVLMKAESPLHQQTVGRQAGDSVLLYLNTDDFWSDYDAMVEGGVRFLESPREEVYATVVVFEDLYGNRWDLLQPKF